MTDQATTERQRRMARQPGSSAGTHDAPTPTKKPNKTEAVLSLLTGPNGATLDELVAATSWLPHTARAALTGLKKKCHALERTKLNGVSRYAIVKQVSQ